MARRRGSTGSAKAALLLKVREGLDEQACAVLADIVDAVRRECRVAISDDSGLVVDAFAQNLLTRLKVHHATAGEKFKKTPFEYAFARANEAVGRAVVVSDRTNPTFAGHDVTVNGVRFSLKTEAEKRLSTPAAARSGISRAGIKVSKFMEMRAIRSFAGPGQVVGTGVAAVLRHLGGYDRILALRGYDVQAPFTGVRYDLYELPVGLLRERVGVVGMGDVSRTKPQQKTGGPASDTVSWKVEVDDGRGKRLCELVFDGSVEKVTLRNLALDYCRLLAHWVIKADVPDESEADGDA